MKLIKRDFSLKAWVRAPWKHRPSIKSQLWYISYLLYLYLHLLPCCCIWNSLWMEHGHILKNIYFNLLTPKAGEGGLRRKYLLPCGCICDSIWFDMQHDHVLKKLILTFDPTPRVCLWLEGSGGKIFATTFLHSWFNLICNLTMFLKGWILTFWLQGQGMGVSGALQAKYLLP